MARREINTDETKVEQRPLDVDAAMAAGKDRREVVEAGEDVLEDTDWLDELKFNEEPVTIYIEPSTEKNALTHHYIAVNGTGCEVWYENLKRWVETPHVPTGQKLTIKRKYLATMVCAKIDTITTDVDNPGSTEFVGNRERRNTSSVLSVTVLEDRNPDGAAWLMALKRRYM